jgi:hypothetical protein
MAMAWQQQQHRYDRPAAHHHAFRHFDDHHHHGRNVSDGATVAVAAHSPYPHGEVTQPTRLLNLSAVHLFRKIIQGGEVYPFGEGVCSRPLQD